MTASNPNDYDWLDREAVARESEATFFTAGGPGGQHRNKVATGVRLLHRPSGIVVTATERRSQAANREVALDRLMARLQAAHAPPPPPRVATKPSRAATQRRQTNKRQRSVVKQGRRPVREE